MSRLTDISVITAIVRHFEQPGCVKCAARSRWNRRKRQRPGNSPSRKSTERK